MAVLRDDHWAQRASHKGTWVNPPGVGESQHLLCTYCVPDPGLERRGSLSYAAALKVT